MFEILLALVAVLPLVALVAFLITFGDERRAKVARLHQELEDRTAERWIKLHRLNPSDQGNYPVHLGDLDLDYLMASPGNPDKVNLLVSNNITREVGPDRTPSLFHNKREIGQAPAPGPAPAPAPAPAPGANELTAAADNEPLQLPAPAPAPDSTLAEDDFEGILATAKLDGYNQKQALALIGLTKNGGPRFKYWAQIYNSLPRS